jgi:Ca-activated chloride channel family protein
MAWIVPLCGWAGFGQFAAGVDLVEVYATVMDPNGRVVSGLTRSDFSVTEDGEPREIVAFAAAEFPLAVAIGVDRSFSMTRDRLREGVAAVREFIVSLRPADQAMVLAIGSETEILAPLSSNRASILSTLDGIEPWGTTPLYDAIAAALDAIEPVKGRRALILLSDGADRYSGASASEVVDKARRMDVLVYPIALGRHRPAFFAELASVTGGRSFHAAGQGTLQSALAAIAEELRSQYLLGYNPVVRVDERSRWHAIQVGVTRPNVRVRARDGYFSR